MKEELLSGGNVTAVCRIDNTVRRPAQAWSPTIQRLLAHARKCGVAWLPEPLGYDECGREILEFLQGDVPHELPDWIWSEAILEQVAHALRQWHDASLSFDVTDAVWGLTPCEPHEVICHNDFAPYNCVFRDGMFVGAFDFDTCAPGPRIWDLAYSAYRFVPLMPAPDMHMQHSFERAPLTSVEMLGRLNRFLRAYAGTDSQLLYTRERLLDMAARRLEAIAVWTEQYAKTSENASLQKDAAMYRLHASWLRLI